MWPLGIRGGTREGGQRWSVLSLSGPWHRHPSEVGSQGRPDNEEPWPLGALLPALPAAASSTAF